LTVERLNSSGNTQVPEVATNDDSAELTRKNGKSFLAFHKTTFGLIVRLRELWEAVKKKKELDDWNPSMNHPLVKCIHESKMAG